MNGKPIIFSTPMVKALLDGRKTQTRRVIKQQPPEGKYIDGCPYCDSGYAFWETGKGCTCNEVKHDFGFEGGYLWVREALYEDVRGSKSYIARKADDSFLLKNGMRREWQWKNKVLPSIHMPRNASRLTLKIQNIRVEQLHDINENDAKAEGVSQDSETGSYVDKFMCLWDSINGKRFPWDSNPWVWVIEFDVIKQNIDQAISFNGE